MESHLAADCRHAERIAVAADAGDHAGNEMAGLRMARIAKESALRQAIGRAPMVNDIAQNAADTGRGA